MKHYKKFERTGFTFAQVVGNPNEFNDSMGRIVINFSYLEDSVRDVIVLLTRTDLAVGKIITSELSFRQKMDVLGSLHHHYLAKLLEKRRPTIKEKLDEIIALCQEAEQLRNTYFHSSYPLGKTRHKTTSKAKRGLHIAVEPIDSALLLDVAEFIGETAYIVRSIPLEIGLADGFQDDGFSISYSKNGKLIAKF
jgi:hypothetical protein